MTAWSLRSAGRARPRSPWLNEAPKPARGNTAHKTRPALLLARRQITVVGAQQIPGNGEPSAFAVHLEDGGLFFVVAPIAGLLPEQNCFEAGPARRDLGVGLEGGELFDDGRVFDGPGDRVAGVVPIHSAVRCVVENEAEAPGTSGSEFFHEGEVERE